MIIFLENVKISPLCPTLLPPTPLPLGLDIDRCITVSIKKQETVLNLKIITVNHRKLYITNVALLQHF